MRVFFTAVFVLLAALSVVAWKLTPPTVEAGKTLVVWATDNNPTRVEQVALFNRLNPDLRLVIDPANIGTEKVIVQSLGGVGPDVFDSYGEQNLRSYIAAGIALDATDFLRSKGIDAQRDLWPVSLPSCVLNGRVYGIPCNVNTNAVWYNKDLFDGAGLPYPKPGWTWDDLIVTAKRLTIKDGRNRPSRFGFYVSFDNYADFLMQFGVRLWSPDGTRLTVDTPDGRAALQLWTDIVYKHNVSPSPAQEAALATQGGWGSGGITFLLGGRVAMAFGGRWWLNLLRNDSRCPRLGVVEIPYAKVEATQGGARCALVNARSPHRQAALRFLEFLAGKEYNELLNDQADAISGVRRFAYTDRFLHNPAHPEEDYNAVWRSALEKSKPEVVSPYIRGSELALWTGQLDLIKGHLKPVPDALRDATVLMNSRVRRVARQQPHLRKLYVESTGEEP